MKTTDQLLPMDIKRIFFFLLKDVSIFAGLQHTKLGEVLENRVNEFLKKNNAGAGEVTIRVVSSVDKIAEIKPGMKSRYAWFITSLIV